MKFKNNILHTILLLTILITGNMIGEITVSADSLNNYQKNNEQQSKINIENALNYVENWWDKRNPNYNTWDPNDCMNYISQILKAGGLQETSPLSIKTSGIDTNNNYWYSKKQDNNNFTESSTWINVEDFYTFWSRTKNVITPENLNIMRDIEIGDVVQLQKKSGGRYYHAMFVVKKDSETVYLTGHTNDREALDIKKITDDNFRVIKFSN